MLLQSTDSANQKRAEELHSTIEKIEDKLESESKQTKSTERDIERLVGLADAIKKNINDERKEIEPIIKKSKEQEEKIMRIQNEIIDKMSGKEKKVQNLREVSTKVRRFFDEKMKATELIDKINKDREDLESELRGLIKKAKGFQLSAKASDIDKRVIKFEKQFKEIDKKKSIFEQEYKKLAQLMKLE